MVSCFAICSFANSLNILRPKGKLIEVIGEFISEARNEAKSDKSCYLWIFYSNEGFKLKFE